MADKDTLTGKWRAVLYLYPAYGSNEEINVMSSPVFTTEEDAIAAEDVGFSAYLATMEMTGNRKHANNKRG